MITYDKDENYQRFNYDANGNRVSLNQEVNKTISYIYKPNSNILQTIKTIKRVDENTTTIEDEQTLTYNQIGAVTNDDNHTYVYDAKNRLIRIDDNITYRYDYDNKRVSKTVDNQTTYFIYDGYKLIGKYDQNGDVITEYIYYQDIPIALIKNDEVYKIYSDHINTPRAVVNNQNQILWQWESKPFGESRPNEDVDNDGENFTLNLRFPGQYFDSETKTHYNINRDYNPITGRYIQSDPIGFEGGINNYLYAGGNPVGITDPEGLFLGILLKEAGKKLLTKISDFTKVAYNYIRRTVFGRYSISDLNANQLLNYKRFMRKIPSNSKKSVVIKKDDSGNIIFEAVSPGKVPGSKAIYIKTINRFGRTIDYKKITIGPDGKIIHIKSKI